ncbi:MAG: hypothetical protein AAGF95_10655 [Chloroflexota bacterium]
MRGWLQAMVQGLRLFIVVVILGTMTIHGGRMLQAAVTPAPILLVVNDSATNPFGPYVGEILRAEGLNAYDIAELGTLSANDLTQHELVILAETALNATQITLLTDYVNNGGRLLALRPDTQLASLFGLTSVGGTINNGYLAIDDSTSLGQGLPDDTLQIHGEADRYNFNGATTLATLYTDATTSTSYPAVVGATYGSGRTAAFTYDLARNVVYMRQGNPANADVDTDGDSILRTIDLFQSSGGGDPWVDRNKIPIPQADVQQRLFARLVHHLLNDTTPLPQLWYFPETAKTMLILTGDAHGNPTFSYQNLINSIEARGGTMSFYIAIAADPNDATVQGWRSGGHEFGIHPYAYREDSYPPYDIDDLEEGYQVYHNWFNTQFSNDKSRTVRNHQVAWKGWTDAAEYAANYNIALDTNFYHWGPWIEKSDGTWPYGHITGSGQPMKFVKDDGTIIPVYQQLTQLVDEHLIAGAGSGYENLSAAQGIAVSQQLIDASLAGDYAALMTQFHVDYYSGDAQAWAEGTLDYANSQNVPIWNADEWLTFIETRYATDFQNVSWDGLTGQLTFDMEAPNTSHTLSVLLPLEFDGLSLDSVEVDSVAETHTVFTISGKQHALVSVPADDHTFVVQYDTPGPTPTSTNTPEATSTPTATNTPTTTNTPENTPTATNTPVTTPTNTPESTPTTTNTPAATSTPTNTPENTPTATDTPEVIPTATNTPEATSTPTNTPENTPTATNTPVPTQTPTPIPDTSTFTHTTMNDFSVCSALDGTTIVALDDGAVQLAGVMDDQFAGSTLSGDSWNWGAWGSGTYTPDVTGGTLSVDAAGGAWVRSDERFNTAVIEGEVDFGSAPWQHFGFGSNNFINNRYAIFSTFNTNNTLFARVNNNGSEQRVTIGTIPTGTHTYRIEWTNQGTTDLVRFFVDGAFITERTVSAFPDLYLYLSNNTPNAPLLVDDVAVQQPFVSSGEYVGCTFDAGTNVEWDTLAWASDNPTGTTLSVETRSSIDEASWSPWSPVASSGAPVSSPDGRYLQYRVAMSTTDVQVSPALLSVTVQHGAEVTIQQSNTPTATSVPTNTPVNTPTATSVPTNTPVNTPTVTNTPTPTNTTVAIPTNTTTVVPTDTPAATPTATVVATTPTGTPTPSVSSITFSTISDFGASCVASNNTVSTFIGDGDIRLAGAFADPFDATTLNSTNWLWGTWNGGTYTPNPNGALDVSGPDGAWVRSQDSFNTVTIEGQLSFGAAPWQHFGFGSNNFINNRYAIFSTFNTNDTLFARINNNGSEQRVTIGTIPSGTHTYRIEWTNEGTNDRVRYFLDGNQVANLDLPAFPNLYVYASHNGQGTTPPLTMDYVDLVPTYVANGIHTSCGIDAGTTVTWESLEWLADVPSGTNIGVEARSSDDTVTWSAWSSVTTNGGALSIPDGRYLQYRFTLVTNDTSISPVVHAITITYN